jgi:hypothetical protein
MKNMGEIILWIFFFCYGIIAPILNCKCNKMPHLRQTEERVPFVNEMGGNMKQQVGDFLSYWANKRNTPRLKRLVGYFLLCEEKTHRIFSSMGFFMGVLIGVKISPKSHGIL